MPSGAVLKIQASPFGIAKALYQSLLKELKSLPLTSNTEFATVYKDLFCAGFSSDDIEAKLWKCFERCTYNAGAGDLKIDADTFEAVERRQDYIKVCMEVAKENTFPFVKSLYAEFEAFMAETTPSSPK